MNFAQSLALGVAVSLPAFAAAEEKKLDLLVPGVSARGGVDVEIVKPIDEFLLAKLKETGHYEVFGDSDIQDMLAVEQQKMLLGCEDDSCLAELAGALGVSMVARASVGKLASVHLLNLKVINTGSAKVEARCVREVTGGLDALLPAVSECINDISEQLGQKYGFEASKIEVNRAQTKLGYLPMLVAGGVAVAAGLGTVALDVAAGSEAAALRDDPGDNDAYKRGKSLQTLERVTFGVTIAAAISTAVLALYTDFSSEPSDAVQVSVAAGSDSASLVLMGRY